VFENTPNVDYAALSKFLQARGLAISNGYGALKGKTMRIAHMGDVTEGEMRDAVGRAEQVRGKLSESNRAQRSG
jgi:aspartate aminotransferase-like enzyme